MSNFVAAFETDTVWGLGCNVTNARAVDEIYQIKGRDYSKPLILMSNGLENLLKYVEKPNSAALSVMAKHFPGALSVILKKSPKCPLYIAPGLETVGIRIPNHQGFWELCKFVKGHVLATTSLNISNEPPCLTYEEAYKKFSRLCKVIKPQRSRILKNLPSTIVDLTGTMPKILRQGSVTLD